MGYCFDMSRSTGTRFGGSCKPESVWHRDRATSCLRIEAPISAPIWRHIDVRSRCPPSTGSVGTPGVAGRNRRAWKRRDRWDRAQRENGCIHDRDATSRTGARPPNDCEPRIESRIPPEDCGIAAFAAGQIGPERVIIPSDGNGGFKGLARRRRAHESESGDSACARNPRYGRRERKAHHPVIANHSSEVSCRGLERSASRK